MKKSNNAIQISVSLPLAILFIVMLIVITISKFGHIKTDIKSKPNPDDTVVSIYQ